MIADVQGWISNSNSNCGWILINELQGTANTICRFGTSEDPANAPSLTVQFTLPAASPVLTALPILANQFRFRFNAQSNRPYAVEHRGSLLESNWAVLTNFLASPSNLTITVSDPLTDSNRFYRVRTP